jgi:A/G-specific adenine glycosylase
MRAPEYLFFRLFRTAIWLLCSLGYSRALFAAKTLRASRQTSIMSSTLLEDWISHSDADFHTLQQPAEIRAALLTWYDNDRRMLPWRGDPPPWSGSTAKPSTTKKKVHSPVSNLDKLQSIPLTAYGVWVSEIMCQQTRVEAVIPYWLQWMQTFPTVHDLAGATDEQVNSLWAGLGFYRRARLLHTAAKHVVNELDGEMPNTVEGLQQLSGVGRYTACAIASIAYGITVPVVDGNVCRVLSRLSLIAQHIKAPELKDKWGWHLAKQIVEAGDGSRPGCVNSALMELGATYCSPSGTGLDDRDPLKGFYLSIRLGNELMDAMEDDKYAHLVNRAVQNGQRVDRCPICETNGMSRVLTDFATIYNETTTDKASDKGTLAIPARPTICGHAVFPLAPPKAHKREDVYAVGVFSCRANDRDDDRWLLVRRPKDGLLANQWEFPAALVWSSDTASLEQKGKKRKDMCNVIPLVAKTARKRALDCLLDELQPEVDEGSVLAVSSLLDNKRCHVGEAPIEHIFSHVRHTMWIEHAHRAVKPETNEWISRTGREVRWMRENDMDAVGVTSGVKKVLKTVRAYRELAFQPHSMASKSIKRRRATTKRLR